MNASTRLACVSLTAAAAMLAAVPIALAENARAIILTDIRSPNPSTAEPDDAQSLVRLLTYANVIDIKGLVVNTNPTSTGQAVVSGGNGLTNIHFALDRYDQARPNLLNLSAAFPTTASLRALTMNGQQQYSMTGVGAGKSSDGSNLIIDEVLNNPNDTRPLHIQAWGGVNTLAQALYDVEHNTRAGKTYTAADLQTMRETIRVYDIVGQDDAGAAIAHQHPDIVYIRDLQQHRAISYRKDNLYSESRGGDERLVSPAWFKNNVQTGHGPLGTAYPDVKFLFEGDTPAFLGLIPNGLSDPEEIAWGGWGGRFDTTETKNPRATHPSVVPSGARESVFDDYFMHTDASDTWTGHEYKANNPGSATTTFTDNGLKTYNSVYAPLLRFRDAIQNDFAARMDWAAFGTGNRNPLAVLNGDTTLDILTTTADPGDTFSLSALGSIDPDNDNLLYNWWVYNEAGTYSGPLSLNNTNQVQASLDIPLDANGRQIHVILEITDTDADTPLTSYRRQILNITGPTAATGLKLDMGNNSTGELQSGDYRSMSVGGADNAIRSQSFTGDFFGQGETTIGVNLSSVDKRDRGNPTGSPLAGLLADAFKKNGDITMTLTGLAAGEYEITTYHHDALDGGDATFDILVDGELKAEDVGVTFGGNLSGGFSSRTFRFTATGSDVVFLFDRQSAGEVFLNGFDLHLIPAAIPEPASLALLGLSGVAMLIGRRRLRG